MTVALLLSCLSHLYDLTLLITKECSNTTVCSWSMLSQEIPYHRQLRSKVKKKLKVTPNSGRSIEWGMNRMAIFVSSLCWIWKPTWADGRQLRYLQGNSPRLAQLLSPNILPLGVGVGGGSREQGESEGRWGQRRVRAILLAPGGFQNVAFCKEN